MTAEHWIGALLAINAGLITILLFILGSLAGSINKLTEKLDTKVGINQCVEYRGLCFRDCPARGHGELKA